jgi:hypothetical protein
MLATMAGIALPAAPAGAQMAPTAPTGAQLAQVQMVCGNRTDMVRQLGEKYGETRRSMGLADGRRVVELYASEETGSWTILMTSPQGIACMMAAGQAFEIEPVKAAGSPV